MTSNAAQCISQTACGIARLYAVCAASVLIGHQLKPACLLTCCDNILQEAPQAGPVKVSCAPIINSQIILVVHETVATPGEKERRDARVTSVRGKGSTVYCAEWCCQCRTV